MSYDAVLKGDPYKGLYEKVAQKSPWMLRLWDRGRGVAV